MTWFQKETFETLLFAMESIALTGIELDAALTDEEQKSQKSACQKLIARIDKAKEGSGYRVEELIRNVGT